MRTVSILTGVVVIQMAAGNIALAQRFTERFIPIGKSPGLSGKHTLIGTAVAVDVKRGTMTCKDSSGTFTVRVDKNTMMWMDRSKRKLRNVVASLDDCQKGYLVEVKFRNNDRRTGVAVWIKMEASP